MSTTSNDDLAGMIQSLKGEMNQKFEKLTLNINDQLNSLSECFQIKLNDLDAKVDTVTTSLTTQLNSALGSISQSLLISKNMNGKCTYQMEYCMEFPMSIMRI